MPDDTNQSNNQNAPSPSPTNSTPYASVNRPVGTAPYGSRPPKKSSRKKLYIIGGIGLAILVAGLTIGAMFLWGRFVQPQPAVEQPATLDTLGDVLINAGDSRDDTSVLIAASADPFAVVRKVGDRTWVGLPLEARVFTFSYTSGDQNKVNTKASLVASVLTTKHFNELTGVSDVKDDYGKERYFSSDTLSCIMNTGKVAASQDEATVGQSGEMSVTMNYAVDLACAENAAFEKAQQETAPYVAGYFASRSDDKNDVIFGTPEVQNGATDGYKYARVVVRSLSKVSEVPVAEFYQIPNSDNWKLFTVAVERDKIPCSQYNSEELTNVYSGFSCWDETAKSASYVKAKAPTFEIEAGAIGG